MSDIFHNCEQCGGRFVQQDEKVCMVLGINSTRLVATGFMLWDSTSQRDVPDLDGCDRIDCAGRFDWPFTDVRPQQATVGIHDQRAGRLSLAHVRVRDFYPAPIDLFQTQTTNRSHQ